jgi:tetratricopeptide (TPR) repeat protein
MPGSGDVSVSHVEAGSVIVLGAGAQLNQDRQLDAPRIRAHLTESSERKRDEDIAAAEKAPTSAERERLRAAAEKADAVRKSRIGVLVDSFVSLDAKMDSTPVLREMTRILEAEGVDAALAYIDGQRASVLGRVRARAEALSAQNRADLQPLLKGAGLYAAKGQNEAARQAYRDVLGIEPRWPEALEAYGWFLVDQSVHSKNHRTIGVAYTDSQEALTVAQGWVAVDNSGDAQRLLSAALEESGDILRSRGQVGDADLALKEYERSLEIRTQLLSADPDSGRRSRDVAVTLNRLGDFLVIRRSAGDSDAALKYFDRSLDIGERLLAGSPNSTEANRDVSVSLNKIGDYLTVRGQAGDLDLAFSHYTRALELARRISQAYPTSNDYARDVSVSLGKLGALLMLRDHAGDGALALDYFLESLKIAESLYSAAPGSVQTARDVSIGLERLGDFLFKRGQPGDWDHAFEKYSKSLEIRERLLKDDPYASLAARDVFVAASKLADLQVARGAPGDAEQALVCYAKNLQLAERILSATPGSALETRDAAVCLNRLGDRLIARNQPGDSDTAWGYFTRSLALVEQLLAADPTSARAERDVYVGLYRVGLFLANHPGHADAGNQLGYAVRSLELTDRNLAANPDSFQAASDVFTALGQLATYYEVHGQAALAEPLRQRQKDLSAKYAPAAPVGPKSA